MRSKYLEALKTLFQLFKPFNPFKLLERVELFEQNFLTPQRSMLRSSAAMILTVKSGGDKPLHYEIAYRNRYRLFI